jgi:hypothetical protein
MPNRRIYRRSWLLAQLQLHGCIDCGEKDPVVLEFDHVRGQKTLAISELSKRGNSIAKLEIEISKCEVRCANCHRRKTVKQLGWYKGVDLLNPSNILKIPRPKKLGQPGESNNFSKLSEKQVRKILKEFAKGASQKSLAKKYGMSIPGIHLIVRRKNWKHITI